ncbi:MAG: DUF262 domain-containing protein [Chitinophagaceae bacterium]
MKISATIGFDEYDFDIISPLPDEQLWIGRKVDDNSNFNYITFRIDNGIISDLKINEDVDTEPGIILERLITALREYNETHQMGFETEDSDSVTSFEEMKPYDPELIKVRPLVLSAFQVHRDIQKGKIDLNPEFQRNFVWNDMQKSLLIESMLLKIPLPAFYFAEDKTGKFQVVDGLQRLTVINQFLNNDFKLRNLEYLHQLEGLYFSADNKKRIKPQQALFDPYDGRVESTQLNINVIEASSPLRVKYDIFYRINTGGRPLNRQEIRNCFATDRVRRLLKGMANNSEFAAATGYSVKDTRMDAQELALRYLGFYLYRESYAGEMNGFLDNVLERLNEISDKKMEEARQNYFKALRCAYYLFGDYAFRKCLPHHLEPGARRQFLNKAMFIVWTVLLAGVDESSVDKKQEEEFVHILAKKLDDNDKLFDALTTGTTDRNNLEFVFNEFQNLLERYLN